MQEYTIKIKLLTDTMFGSGQMVPGVIDRDVQHDSFGLPFMRAKTFKGILREQMEQIQSLLKERYESIVIDELLGFSDEEGGRQSAKLKLTQLNLPQGIRQAVYQALESRQVTKDEILDSLTTTYEMTALDDKGIAQNHSLRKMRTIIQGLTFESVIYAEHLTPQEEEFLAVSIRAIQHIGAYANKGRGAVDCVLYNAKGEEVWKGAMQ